MRPKFFYEIVEFILYHITEPTRVCKRVTMSICLQTVTWTNLCEHITYKCGIGRAVGVIEISTIEDDSVLISIMQEFSSYISNRQNRVNISLKVLLDDAEERGGHLNMNRGEFILEGVTATLSAWIRSVSKKLEPVDKKEVKKLVGLE